MNNGKLANARGNGGISDYPRPRHAGFGLLEQFQPFPTQTIFKRHEPSSVAAWPRKAFGDAGTDWVGDIHKHNWDGPGGLQ